MSKMELVWLYNILKSNIPQYWRQIATTKSQAATTHSRTSSEFYLSNNNLQCRLYYCRSMWLYNTSFCIRNRLRRLSSVLPFSAATCKLCNTGRPLSIPNYLIQVLLLEILFVINQAPIVLKEGWMLTQDGKNVSHLISLGIQNEWWPVKTPLSIIYADRKLSVLLLAELSLQCRDQPHLCLHRS